MTVDQQAAAPVRGEGGARVFAFDPADHANTYREQGWVHVRDGIAPGFLAAVEAYARTLEDHKLDGFAIRGKKEQALFEFPPEFDVEALCDDVAALCGLDPAGMTLSERHFQIYDAGANPEPTAHKDRFPSQVSVGLSVAIPEGSQLVLYADSHRELNPFNTSAGLVRDLQPEEHPDVVLRDAQEVVLDDRRGDVVLFPGSTTWHLRRNAARAVNLYLKFNDFGCDPLGEDPRTPAIREASVAAARSAGDGAGALVPRIGRRFDTLTVVRTRAGWDSEILQARVFGDEPFGITPLQFAVAQAADGRRSVDDLIGGAGANGDAAAAPAQVLRLVEQGVLDLAP